MPTLQKKGNEKRAVPLNRRLQEIVESSSEAEHVIAQRFMAELEPHERDYFAELAIMDMAWDFRRDMQIQAERRSKISDTKETRNRRFEAILAEPNWFRQGWEFKSRAEINEFKEYAGDRFTEWCIDVEGYIQRSRDELVLKTFNRQLLDSIVNGTDEPMPAEEKRRAIFSMVDDLIEKRAQRQRLLITEELMKSEFALGDGTRIKWSESTVEHHETRIALLRQNIVGNIEVASGHLLAIRAIRSAGCVRLGQLEIGSIIAIADFSETRANDGTSAHRETCGNVE